MGKETQYFALVVTACLLVTLLAKGVRHEIPNDNAENEEKGVSKVRVKRGWWIPAIIIGIVIGYAVCHYVCDTEDNSVNQPPEDNDDPKFTFCPGDIHKTIPKGQTSVIVTWEEPRVEDATSSISSNTQYTGSPSGSSFSKTEVISYLAFDEFSHSAKCIFTVDITVITCQKPISPQQGRVHCPDIDLVIWGDSCNWSCYEGYELSTSSTSTQECEENGKFSNGGVTECIKKRCPDVTASLESHMSVDSCSHNDEYESVCLIKCDDGYGPQDETWKLKCNSDKKWKGNLDTCTELKDKEPPYFTYCPRDIAVTIPKGKTSVKVTWEKPAADDNDSGVARIVQTKGSPSGALFNETTLINYKAFDKENNSEQCSFQILATLITCEKPVRQRRGDVNCPTDLVIWGDDCTWSCESGFESSGTTSQMCMENGHFSDGGNVSCSKKQCPDINDMIPDNMVLHTCTNANYFDSICIFNCKDGYGPHDQTRIVKCTAEQMWTGTYKECKDTQPPSFEYCPDPIVVNTSRGQDYGKAYWNEPIATDNTNEPKIYLDVGLSSGSEFSTKPTNLHLIVYNATDSEGNEAQCQFTVLVKDRTCAPYSDSEKMSVSCDGFTWGSACNLTCDNGYPLNGSSVIYCEENEDKILEWDVGAYDPHCKILPCPDLNPPENGALACSNWLHGRYCRMSCNSNYDLSRADPSGEWVCDTTTGLWNPTNQPSPCTKRRDPRLMDQRNELFYFTGNCTSIDAQNEIKNNFIKQINSSRFQSICNTSADCVVDNVDIECGPIARRKKSIRNERSDFTHMVKISFVFRMNINYPVNFTSDDAVNLLTKMENIFFEMSDLFQDDVSNGVMDLHIPGLAIEVDPDSFSYGWSEFVCEYGMQPKYTSFSCAMCPKGTMYNSDTDDCLDCPIGTYQDEPGQLQCKQCPKYTSTVSKASTHINQCKQMCDVGYFSINGLTPCAFCSIGTYQDEMGSTFCKNCPFGTNTLSTRSNDIDLCLNIDEIDNYFLCNRTACNGGICLFNSDGSTHCVCYDGYYGESCEIPPDPCKEIKCDHGGSCIPLGGNYTCECPFGYTKPYCQNLAQNGAFTEWSFWSKCSVSCGSGTRSRYRECKSPAPGPNGLPCSGENQDDMICHLEECPVCELLKFPESYRYECEISEANDHVCNIWCKDGYAKINNRFRTIRCGPQTDYEWSFRIGNPYRNLPSCAKSFLPATLSLTSTLANPSIPCSSTVSFNNVQAFVDQHSNCTEMPKCQTNLFTECREKEAKRSIRSVGSSLTIVVEMVGTLPTIDYFPNGEYNRDIAIQAAESWMALASDMNNLIESLTDSSTSGDLVVIADGVEYTVTHEFISDQTCAHGKVPEQGLCVTCPVGTKQNFESCDLCNEGYYQDREGQDSCTRCPEGYTTHAEGSISSTQCYNPAGINNTTPTTTTDKNVYNEELDNDNHDDNKHHGSNDSENVDHTENIDNDDGETTEATEIKTVNLKQTPDFLYPTVGTVIGVLFIVILIVSVTIVCKKKQKLKTNCDNSTKYGAAIESNDYGYIAKTANGCTPAITKLPECDGKVYSVRLNSNTNPLSEKQGESDFQSTNRFEQGETKCTPGNDNDETTNDNGGCTYSYRPVTATSVTMNSRPTTATSISMSLSSPNGSVVSLGGLPDDYSPCTKIE